MSTIQRENREKHTASHEDDALVSLALSDELRDTALKFTPLLGTSHHETNIKRQDAFAHQKRRNRNAISMGATDDSMCEALGDGRLANAWLPQQDGVVLGAACKDLGKAVDLLLAPKYLRQPRG